MSFACEGSSDVNHLSVAEVVIFQIERLLELVLHSLLLFEFTLSLTTNAIRGTAAYKNRWNVIKENSPVPRARMFKANLLSDLSARYR